MMRARLSQLVTTTADSDLLGLLVGCLVEMSRPAADALATGFMERQTAISSVLALQPYTAAFFRTRTTEALHAQLLTFLDSTFSKEITQVVEATYLLDSQSGSSSSNLLRDKLSSVVREEDATAIKGLEIAYTKMQNAKLNPAPVAQLQVQQQQAQMHQVPPGLPQQAAAVAPAPAAAPADPQEVAFTNAALAGNTHMIEQMLTAGVKVNCAPEPGRYTALMNSTLQGHVQCTRYLLSARADCNQQDENGFTPLMYAAQHKRYDLVELLVSAGSDLNLCDKAGRSFINYVTDPFIRQAYDRGISARSVASLPQQGPALRR